MSIVTDKGAATYALSVEQLVEIIATDMKVDPKSITVDFVIGRRSDPMDRGPGTPFVSGAKVSIKPAGK